MRTVPVLARLPSQRLEEGAGASTPTSGSVTVTPRSIVSLLRPPVVVLPGALATHGPTPPLGAAYVAAALREAGHEVDLIDGAGEAIGSIAEVESPVGTLERIGLSPEAIVDRMRPDTTIVGISTMFLHEWPTVKTMAVLVKERFPDALLVLGGENATAFAPYILEQSAAVDGCVMGEGESTMVTIADHRARGLSVAGLEGLMMRDVDGGDAIDTGLSVRLGRKELNERIPRPAWDLVPLDDYWNHYPFFGVHRGRGMQMLGTRGCPYKCSFCSSPNMWTTKYVTREPADVVDEIGEYVDRYGIENVNFVDLTAATNRKWTLGLCEELAKRDFDIEWQLPSGTRIEAIDREVLEQLYATGCRNITFAPESGSERLLDIMDKRVKLDRVLAAVEDSSEIGIKAMINILIGHPDERWSDLFKSVRFMWTASWKGCSDIAVMMFCPYPGSADFKRLVESGEHVLDDHAYYVGLSRGSSNHQSWNPRMSPRQLRLMQLLMISSFYIVQWVRRPRRALRFLRSLFGGSEETYLEQMVRTKRKNLKPVPDSVHADQPGPRSSPQPQEPAA